MTRKYARREILIGSAAGAAMLAGRSVATFASASQAITPLNFDGLNAACDCHTHIFGDPRRFPFAKERAYTPEPAGIDALQALHLALRIYRVVIVQPSVYGTDNSCTLDAIRRLGPTARGIAVIDDNISTQSLDELHRAGVRGIRINLETAGETNPAIARQRFQTAVQQIKSRNGWHIQMYTRPSVIAVIEDAVSGSPVPVTFDHFGGVQAALGMQQPGFDALLRLLKSGKAHVKLSAPYRSSTQAPDYADIAPFARALVAANPQRALWGSDWPHPQQIAGRSADEITPPYAIDDSRAFKNFAAWVPDSARRRMVLVDNPAKLYAF
jgi:predicted TIM-barrel fold metal-dependent hydrolase